MPKKRGHPDVEELLERPFCYYCERDFDDLRILISHQKAKHFKCDRCNRRLNTAGGLSVHLTQVHKEGLDKIDNALPNRSEAPGIEIFGMEGIPDEILQQHKQRVITEFHQARADRQAATGNPPPGSNGAGGASAAKKTKTEDKMSLKERLAAHKAKKNAGLDSGESTPVAGGVATQSPVVQQEAAFGVCSPPFPLCSKMLTSGLLFYRDHILSSQRNPATTAGFPPPGKLSPPQNGLPNRSPGLPAGPPGLPQRPSFGAPPVNQFQMQQMHQGHYANTQRGSQEPGKHNQNGSASGSPAPNHIHATAADVDDLIATAAKESKANGEHAVPLQGTTTVASTPPDADKKTGKKDKDKAKKIHLVYSDSEVSPEEKMAQLPRYRKYFGLALAKEETVLSSSIEATAGVAGVAANGGGD
ncbi:hypothetical protein FH972_022794 [Carpinus fangiana]|uniref:C2H2-type domain-containing protein n=1 Tax=Carpinus fangiana TaxID=176857 RepID=A0A5N6KTA2_9ROSI|nr:hypothetical protein FH972_022794 [Carpinus fangiana]